MLNRFIKIANSILLGLIIILLSEYCIATEITAINNNKYVLLNHYKPPHIQCTLKSIIPEYKLEKTTGIPLGVLKILSNYSKCIPISIRANKTSLYRFEAPFDSKPSIVHQKSSNLAPIHGHLAEIDELTRLNKKTKKTLGVDLTDHSFGNFPIKAIPIQKTTLQKYHDSAFLYTDEIKEIEGRVCYSKIMPRFKEIPKELNSSAIMQEATPLQNSQELLQNPSKFIKKIICYKNKFYRHDTFEPNAKKIYIQEIQNITKILKQLANGKYVFNNFENGILTFSYPTAVNLEFSGNFQSNFNLAMSVAPESALWQIQTPNKSNANIIKKLPLVIQKYLQQNPNIIHKSVPIDIAYSQADKIILKPLMVQAGNTGYPITGDFDLINVDLPKEMPQLGFKTLNTYVDGVEIFIEDVKLLRDILTLRPEQKRNLLTPPKLFTIYPHATTISETVLDYDYTVDPKFSIFQNLKVITTTTAVYDPMFDYLTPLWIRPQGKMHAAAYLINCALNIAIGKPMFNHGAESFNPGDSAEFTAASHYYKGQIFQATSEADYLEFYFYDQDYLATKFIQVHPYWLRNREVFNGAPDLSDAWMDLIKIQILNGNAQKISTATQKAYDARVAVKNAYFMELLPNANNPNYKIKIIMEKTIGELINEAAQLDPKHIATLKHKLYKRHYHKCH